VAVRACSVQMQPTGVSVGSLLHACVNGNGCNTFNLSNHVAITPSMLYIIYPRIIRIMYSIDGVIATWLLDWKHCIYPMCKCLHA
jgi:hypothetical protein